MTQVASPRSWLFVPGDNERKIEKAARAGADAVIIDLEDSVGPDAKPAAREACAAALRLGCDVPMWVRVNALETGLVAEDVAATLSAGPAGYVLPKCEGRADIEALARIIDETGAPSDLPIMVIATETARAVRNLGCHDWSHPRLHGMAWGAEDLAADIGAMANRDAQGAFLRPFLHARDTMLMAAKAAGVAAIDTVFTDFRNSRGLEDEADAAQSMGFSGKLAIHPSQVAQINASFTPTAAQIEWAERVIAVLEAAEAAVAQLDGRMVDQPHLTTAQAILARRDAAQA